MNNNEIVLNMTLNCCYTTLILTVWSKTKRIPLRGGLHAKKTNKEIDLS